MPTLSDTDRIAPQWWPVSQRNGGRIGVGTVDAFPPEWWPVSAGIRSIGADAAIDLKKFFEIKASAREMPDRVELTLNELDRARLSDDSFYLVVVSGLEEGYETTLHIYKNPLRTLDWSPSRSLVVSGLKSKPAVQVKLDVDPSPAEK